MLWLSLALLLILSGMVSGSETALFGLSRQALYSFGRSRGRLRRRVYLLMSAAGGPRRVLMTVLMANTAVNVAVFAIAFLALRQTADLPAAVAAVGSALAPVCVIIFGEMLPKAVALSNSHRFAPPAAVLVSVLQTVLGPVQLILARLLVDPVTRLLAPQPRVTHAVTTEELKLLVEHSAREGIIDSTENEILQAVVALADVSVREVMTPRVDIRSLPLDSDRATVLKAVEESGRRHLPVCGRDLDDIRGVIHARDLYLNPGAGVKSGVRRVRFVPEQANLMQLLRHFRAEKAPLAIVVDEYGGTAGLVTVGDVIEWIVGELPDAESRSQRTTSERIDENTYRLSGDLSVRVWADRFAVREIDRQVDTLGGLILAKLGRLPCTGDAVRIRNLTLTVESMQRRRIERVLLHRDSGLPEPPAGRRSSSPPPSADASSQTHQEETR